MKLYYSPGACSQASHIVLHETGLEYDKEKVNIGEKTTESGGAFLDVNPKGQVPVLELDDGQILTEGSVIVQYLADKAPDAGLLPAAGTMERVRVQEWLSFVGSELHKPFDALFNPAVPEKFKLIVAVGIVGLQNTQTVADGDARCNNQEPACEKLAGR